jgi:hypothetical protein
VFEFANLLIRIINGAEITISIVVIAVLFLRAKESLKWQDHLIRYLQNIESIESKQREMQQIKNQNRLSIDRRKA